MARPGWEEAGRAARRPGQEAGWGGGAPGKSGCLSPRDALRGPGPQHAGGDPWSLKGWPLHRRKPTGRSSSSPRAVVGSGLGVALAGGAAPGAVAPHNSGRSQPLPRLPPLGSCVHCGKTWVGVQSPHSWRCSGPEPSFIFTPILPLGLTILTFYFRYILNVNTVNSNLLF